jgi:hypothetical protein
MSTILNTKGSPPNAIDDSVTVASRSHSQHAVLSESYIASQFMERYGYCIRRYAYDDGDAFMQLASIAIYDPPNPYTVKQGCYRLPNSYVLDLIRALIVELSADSDTFTRVRVNSSKFIFGVLALLLGTPRIPKLHDPSPGDFDAMRAKESLSMPRMEDSKQYTFEDAEEHHMRMRQNRARNYG